MAVVMSHATNLSRNLCRPVPRAILAWVTVGCVGGCVPVFHRSLPDLVYSGVTGRDCSMVRLDRGESYCLPVAPPPPPQPYCTHSLAGIDCWAQPERMQNLPPQVAELPNDPAVHQGLTTEQNRGRLARWPADLQ